MTYWFILKVLHIFAAFLWVGGGVIMIYFIAPAVRSTAPAGGAVMGALANKYKLPLWLTYAAWTTTIAGLVLFWRTSGGLQPVYFSTLTAQALTVGAIAGMLAFIGAVFVQLPRSKRIARLSAEAGATPSGEQAAVILGEQKKFALGGHVVVACFAIALLGMLMGHPI